jgi:hypothetical protein
MASKATVYAAAQYGLATETTATGLVVGSISWDGSCDTVELPDHIGCVIGLSVGNPRKEVKCDGIIATKATGLVGNLGAVLTLSNTTTNSRTRNSEGLDVTPAAGAGIIITSNAISPTSNGFEGGSVGGVYFPFIATATVYTAT